MVTAAFDPLLGKLVTQGASRSQAIAKAIAALRDLVVLGVRTNAAYLGAILAHPAFAEGATDTAFLDRHGDELLAQAPAKESLARALGGGPIWPTAKTG